MKTMIVISDSHGNVSALEGLSQIMKYSDYIVHLGDYQRDIKLFSRDYGDRIYSVKGNCDLGHDEQVIEVEDVKVLLTHGNAYGVKSGLTNLSLRAKELNVDLVLYGHTHLANIEVSDGITYVNPGTTSRYQAKSYAYVVIHEKKITAKIVDIREMYESI